MDTSDLMDKVTSWENDFMGKVTSWGKWVYGTSYLMGKVTSLDKSLY